MNAKIHDTLAVRVKVVLVVEVGAAKRVGYARNTLAHVDHRLLLRHRRAHVDRAISGQVLYAGGGCNRSHLSGQHRRCCACARVAIEIRIVVISFGRIAATCVAK